MKIPTSVIRVAGNALSTIKKYSPQIMMAIGTISSVAAVVEAVKQTPRAMDILEEHKKDKESIEAARAEYPEEYSEQEYKKELVALYEHFGKLLFRFFCERLYLEDIVGTLFVHLDITKLGFGVGWCNTNCQ